MEKEIIAYRAHVLVLPFPAQGHMNPLLQFAKRLASKGLKVTLAIAEFLTKFMHAEAGLVGVETIFDGFGESDNSEDKSGISEADRAEAYFARLKDLGSQSLAKLIKKHDNSGNPVTCLIYDSICPWALDLAKEFGLVGASFFTQSCSVCSICYHVHHGMLTVPVVGLTVSIPELPPLGLPDLPSYFFPSRSVPAVSSLLAGQFSNIEKADWLLFNTFDKLEGEVVKWMTKIWKVRAIGPSVPSMYLDKRVEGNVDYSINLFKPSDSDYIKWLNTRETGSVIYVSFGSVTALGEEQMEEIAWGLRQSNKFFLWVVRDTEESKLPRNFVEETSDKGLVVTWCSQLEVLAHEALGCFVTHCGWNSILESLSLGVPMVAMPIWFDQTTNAKFVQDVWEVGIRTREDDKGIVRREELELCIREVMEGEKGKEIKKNASKWREFTKDAVDEGGSSNENIEEFVACLVCT